LGTVKFNVARLLEAIMDLVFMIGMVYAISRTIRGILGDTRRNPNGRGPAGQKAPPRAAQGRTARDPVCGMFVSTEVSHRLVEGGNVLHFCSKNCMESYEKNKARA
jgi:YHS domain-containing protein